VADQGGSGGSPAAARDPARDSAATSEARAEGPDHPPVRPVPLGRRDYRLPVCPDRGRARRRSAVGDVHRAPRTA